jgi:sodium/bile acid cotransporter 7
VAVWFGLLTKLAVALLFFMHGAKLSRQNLLAGPATGGCTWW